MSARPPSGTVTFLVTSIQDSARRWDEAPAEMAAAQRVHDAIVRDAIEGHVGHVFAADADGFCAAFATAAAWEEGIAFVHEHRIHFFEGFIARDAARPHTSDGEPDVALGRWPAEHGPCSPARPITGQRPNRLGAHRAGGRPEERPGRPGHICHRRARRPLRERRSLR